MVLADYKAYVNKQEEVSELFKDQQEWNRKAILNTANIGKFSSDRTINDYNDEIWKAPKASLK
jgi:starch phosphorylase